MSEPYVGQQLYVWSSFYIDHGEDDFVGGLATVSKVIQRENGHFFVKFQERPDWEYSYGVLMEKQEELRKEFGNQRAHEDPDYG